MAVFPGVLRGSTLFSAPSSSRVGERLRWFEVGYYRYCRIMAAKVHTLSDGPPSAVFQSIPVEASTAPFVAGELIGDKYVFERVLAEGGMAVVLSVLHQELNERVAIKVLKPEMLLDRDLVVRFAREAKTTVRVRSEYSVKVLDVGVDRRRGPFIVMELLHGEDLRAVIDRTGAVPERRVTEMAIQACEALGSAHVQNIVHRDVKPENIFVTTDGNIDSIRVLDFGISKSALTGSVMNTDVSLLKTQVLMGSPLYMAPEQMRASAEVDARTDIWALGVTMYELLSGKLPFESESVTQVCSLVLESRPEPLSLIAPGVSAGLCNVVMKCLEKEPRNRYNNTGELAVALLPYAPSRARMSVERLVQKFSDVGTVVAAPSSPSTAPPPYQGPRTDEIAFVDATGSRSVLIPAKKKSNKVLYGIAGVGALLLGALALGGYAGRQPPSGPAAAGAGVVAPPRPEAVSLPVVVAPGPSPSASSERDEKESAAPAPVVAPTSDKVVSAPIGRAPSFGSWGHAKSAAKTAATEVPSTQAAVTTAPKVERAKVLDDAPRVKALE
jgi:serine/threonine protein kinase